MKSTYYRIADHLVCIKYTDEKKNDETLIPSFRPFVAEPQEGEECLLTLTVDDEMQCNEERDEVGQFDGSGNNYGVYAMPDGGYLIEMSNWRGELCGVLRSDRMFTKNTIALKSDLRANRMFAVNNAIMLAYAYAGADKDTVLLHASVIRKDGRGYMMTAPSGTGKSTHTFLWYKNIPGCDLMNDDNPVVRIIEGKPIIYGTPWSGKTPCYKNQEAPVGGFVFLSQAPYNKIQRLRGVSAYAALLPSISGKRWDKAIADGLHCTENALASHVPVWHLECLPDEAAAKLCCETIA